MSFSIGANYKDKVWCDVMWLPWMLVISCWVDHDNMIGLFVHDGRKNTYIFMFDNVKSVLMPSKEVEPKLSKGDGKNLLARKEYADKMLASRVVFVLLEKE